MNARCGRRRRAGFIVSSTILLLLILRLIWGGIANARLSHELAAIGPDPKTPQELFALPQSGHNRPNAVPLIVQAMGSVDDSEASESPAMSNMEYRDYPPFPPAWHKKMDAAMVAPGNVKAMRLVREARSRDYFYWDITPSEPMFRGTFPKTLNKARSVANLIGDAALHAHVHGDDLAALERVRDVFHHADVMDAQRLLISHLVATGIDALGLHRLMVIAPGLKIPPREEGAPIRREVRAMITELLDDRGDAPALRRAFTSERVLHIDTARWLGGRTWVIGPMYELDLARTLRRDQVVLRATTQPNKPASLALLATLPPKREIPFELFGSAPKQDPEVPRFARQVSDLFAQGMDRVIETDMRVRLDRRAAAVSLAAQLYRADHAAWPTTIDALVPAYLPAAPLDPFAAENGTLALLVLKNALPNGQGDRPLVRSVGSDGVAAESVTPPQRPAYGWQHTGRGQPDDQYRDVSRWVEPPAPPLLPPSDEGAFDPSTFVDEMPVTQPATRESADEAVADQP